MHAHISALLEQAIIDGILELEVPIPESDGAVCDYDLKQMTRQRVVGGSKYKTMRRIRRIVVVCERDRLGTERVELLAYCDRVCNQFFDSLRVTLSIDEQIRTTMYPVSSCPTELLVYTASCATCQLWKCTTVVSALRTRCLAHGSTAGSTAH